MKKKAYMQRMSVPVRTHSCLSFETNRSLCFYIATKERQSVSRGMDYINVCLRTALEVLSHTF